MNGGRRQRYLGPSSIHTASLRDVVARLPRPELAEAQLDLLDRPRNSSAQRAQLFMAGDPSLLAKRCIAIIGARKATELGRRRADQLGRQLASAGVVVVSGLAEEIDTAALTGAMRGGGQVVAVIGTPLEQAYPAANARLQEEIYGEHLLVSQFHAGERVFPSNFPARNRTMAALSDASVVIEASDTSGTLHQAVECQRLGRWLVIARSVVDDPRLTWPAKFMNHPRTIILETTAELLRIIYGENNGR